MVEVDAKQRPYFTTTAFKKRMREAFGLPVFMTNEELQNEFIRL